MQRVCEYIKSLSKKSNVSQASLAKQTGITGSRLTRFFSDHGNNFSLDEINALCLALDTNLISVLINSGYISESDLSGFQACLLDTSGLSAEDLYEIRNLIDIKQKARAKE